MPSFAPTRSAAKATLVVAAVVLAGAWSHSSPGVDATKADGPSFSAEGRLLRPTDYREWIYVSSGLGMTYGPAEAAEGREPRFDNIFVTRAAYREFLGSGIWPDGTMFMLEVRSAESNVSINNGGRTQGRVLALEAAVKDRERFPDRGWGYYSFDGPDGLVDSATALPETASCYSCHGTKAAVENTFVQFYPTLFDVAKRHGTIRPEFDPASRP